ncbi:MAG: 3-deoxy-8-phosphooctulonate synthase [Phycisphaerales bacterium]
MVIGGPCVLETPELSMEIGEALRKACAEAGFAYVFKASYDKANRSSAASARGPGMEAGLDQLASLRERLGVPVLTDVHGAEQCARVAQSVDVLQIPAFLCRQTDLLVAAGEACADGASVASCVNIKKGQFLSPGEMGGPVDKVRGAGCAQVMVTERGTFFGYGRLVNDFVGMGELLDGVGGGERRPPVCYDATHSVQRPGARDADGRLYSGGARERVPMLCCAAVAAGVDALFIECHPDPERAPSDGANMLRLADAPGLIRRLARVREAALGA